MNQRIAFIIPGSTEHPREEKYQKIAGYFKETGIRPVMIDIDWKRKTMSDYVVQFLTEYSKNQADEIYFQGFSWGAMIAFIASTQVKVDAQILCSLSPYFAEDIPTLKAWWLRYIGKKRMANFRAINSADLVGKVTCRTILIAGEKEGPEVSASNERVYSQLTCPKKLLIIPGSKHDIKNPDYQRKIEEVIKNI